MAILKHCINICVLTADNRFNVFCRHLKILCGWWKLQVSEAKRECACVSVWKCVGCNCHCSQI